MNHIQGAGKFQPVESGGICWPPGLSAQLLLLVVSMIVIGGHRAKFPLNPGLCLCFYLCNGVRRYFRSQKIIIKELAPVGHKESNAFCLGFKAQTFHLSQDWKSSEDFAPWNLPWAVQEH